MSKHIEVTLEQLQQNAIGAYQLGAGQPVAVTSQGVVVFYLAAGSDLLSNTGTVQSQSLPQAPVAPETSSAGSPGEPVRNTATVSVTQAAELLGKHKSTISRAITKKELNCEISGSDYHIKIEDLALKYQRPDLLNYQPEAR